MYAMKTEVVILLHPNQQILLRTFQKSVCADGNDLLARKGRGGQYVVVPSLPLCIRPDASDGTYPPITDIEVRGAAVHGTTAALSVLVTAGGAQRTCFLDVCFLEMLGGERSGQDVSGISDFCGSFLSEYVSSVFCGAVSSLGIKRISPFRIAVMETERTCCGQQWIFSDEKWVTLSGRRSRAVSAESGERQAR